MDYMDTDYLIKSDSKLKSFINNNDIPLDLKCSNITDSGVSLLLNISIPSLHISSNRITDKSVLALVKNTSITKLYLKSNKITDKGILALSKSTSIIDLELDVKETSDKCLSALLKSRSIVRLHLSSIRIHITGTKLVLPRKTIITDLNLWCVKISNEYAKIFSKYTSITTLKLSWNKITDRGAIALAKSTSITSLDLSDNKIKDKGAIALSKNTSIVNLNLGDTDITNVGVLALSKSISITNLDLGGAHNLSKKLEKLLLKNISLSKIELNYDNTKTADIINSSRKCKYVSNCLINRGIDKNIIKKFL
jgi:hypothetical protein